MDVVTVGEALVDWVSTEPGLDLSSARTFVKAPGGAPANVAVGLVRLGVRAGFVGAFAADAFGDWLHSILAEAGVDTSLSPRLAGTQTRMAFVTTMASGDRDMAAFLSLSCADALLSLGDLDCDAVLAAPMLHFGSVGLAAQPSQGTTLWLAHQARQRGRSVSFDANWRAVLWPDAAAAREAIAEAAALAHVVKLNLDELELLSGTRDAVAGCDKVWSDHMKLLVITRGADGAYYRTSREQGAVAAPSVAAVDATGAGDAFMACLLAEWVCAGENVGHHAVQRACAAGSLATTRVGAMSALPARHELDAFTSRSGA
jgi:fructokinase